jgi:hypothetical protein
MKRAQPGWLVLALAAIAAAIGSFLPFYTFSDSIELTVWSRNLFPTATLIPVLLVLIGLEALFVLVVGHEPRSPFLNFTWSQARLAGSSFAIVLALSFLVQGRAGADLGSGYLVLSLSTLGAFAGAVMTRRAELARGREEIVRAEHPWRAAALRWRRELTAKVEAFAAGANEPRVQPAPVSPDGEKDKDEKPVEQPVATPVEKPVEEPVEEPFEMPEKPAPTPTPVPRLSAVRSGPEAETKPKRAARARTSPRRSSKKAASRKTVPKAVEPTLVESEPEAQKPAATKTEQRKTEEQTEEPKADEPETGQTKATTAEAPTDETTVEEPTVEVPKAADVETDEQTAEQQTTDITAEMSPANDSETDTSSENAADEDAERERPAAPG